MTDDLRIYASFSHQTSKQPLDELAGWLKEFSSRLASDIIESRIALN